MSEDTFPQDFSNNVIHDQVMMTIMENIKPYQEHSEVIRAQFAAEYGSEGALAISTAWMCAAIKFNFAIVEETIVRNSRVERHNGG